MKKNRTNTSVLLVLLLGFFLGFPTGCATMEKMFTWVPFLNFAEKRDRPEAKEVDQFLSRIKFYKGDPDSLYKQACYFQKRNKHRLAIENFKSILLADPNNVRAYNGMGVSYDLLGDLPRAIESYKAALEVNANLDYVQNNLGYTYLRLGKLDAAIAAFQKAIALNNQKGLYHNNLGLAYVKKGQLDQGFDEFMLAEDKARAHYNMAQVLYQNGSYGEAKTHFARASVLNPSISGVKIGLRAAELLANISQDKAKNPEQKTDIKQQSLGKEIVVEISNGNGVYRMARRMRSYLRKMGIERIRISNARHFNYAKSKIYYPKGYLDDADHLARLIPGNQDTEKVAEPNSPNIKIRKICFCKGYLSDAVCLSKPTPGHQDTKKLTKIRILIGKDMIPYDQIFTKAYQKS